MRDVPNFLNVRQANLIVTMREISRLIKASSREQITTILPWRRHGEQLGRNGPEDSRFDSTEDELPGEHHAALTLNAGLVQPSPSIMLNSRVPAADAKSDGGFRSVQLGRATALKRPHFTTIRMDLPMDSERWQNLSQAGTSIRNLT